MTEAVDNAKRRYSQDLAAYTLEQWRIARRQLLDAQAAREQAAPAARGTGSSAVATQNGRRSRTRRNDDRGDEHDTASDSDHYNSDGGGKDVTTVKASDYGRKGGPMANGIVRRDSSTF